MRAILLTTTLCLAVGLVSWAVACTGEQPDAVLECYSQVFADRDLAALEELYADDYVWVSVVPPGAEVWSREKAMAASEAMFEHEDVVSLELTFGGKGKVVPGAQEGTWMIQSVEATFTTVYGKAPEPNVARTCATYYVREVEGETGQYEIYREVTFGNADCGGWTEVSD